VLEGHLGSEVSETKEMLNLVVEYYKNIFGKEDRLEISLMDSFWDPEDLVSNEENDMLDAPFTEDEIKEAVFGSYAEGALGLDGFTFLFYLKFWETIQNDLINLFRYFDNNSTDLFRLNFSLVTLIQKEVDARNLKKFRPIALSNCCFKIFSKACTKRMGICVDRLISSNQTSFIRGRYILESVVTTHEVIHDVHHNKEEVIVLKLDYEKA
jgi:hypothetical protein